jgi:hypothetical protein
MHEVIAHCHPFRDWIVLDEVPLDGGKRTVGTPKIDALAIKINRSGGSRLPFTRVAYEIKLNRQDFLREIRNPVKRQKAYQVCDYYWFLVPEDLVADDEVPSECGLLWVPMLAGYPIVVKMAERLNTKPPSPDFMMDVARRAYQIGRRDGSATCAFERFDLLLELVQLLVQSTSSRRERMAAVKTMASALSSMQRHAEARELLRVASGQLPTSFGILPRLNSSSRVDIPIVRK